MLGNIIGYINPDVKNVNITKTTLNIEFEEGTLRSFDYFSCIGRKNLIL